MSSGLLALLDDVAAIAKVAAASIDDVAAQTIKTSGKAVGIVIDDAAVTPKYVIGLSPKRELPIVWNIAKGSIKNKLIFLLPALLVLGAFAPWLITVLLAIGGLYLCFEGFEKLQHIIAGFIKPEEHAVEEEHIEYITPEELERVRTSGAIRTDLILSAEIMAISYAQLVEKPFIFQLSVLVSVAVLITAAVYGSVAILLKADDVGQHLAGSQYNKVVRSFGRGLVKSMPHLLGALGVIGTFAMLWVGGQIIIHSIPPLHHFLSDYLATFSAGGFVLWTIEALIGLLFGVLIGGLLYPAVKLIKNIKTRKI